MRKIKGVLVADGQATVTEVDDDLDAYYKLLDCELIDIVTRRIGGKYFDVVCDEEGMWKEYPAVGMVNQHDGTLMLVGRLFICQHDGRGNQKSLSQTEIAKILGSFRMGVVWGDY